MALSYLAYLPFTAVLVATPGAATAVVVRNTLAGGRRAGMAAALGAALGNTTHAAAAGLGLAVLVTRWPAGLTAIRVAGAAFLCWLGIRSLSWFLFASAGTPTIMAIIQGLGVAGRDAAGRPRQDFHLFSDAFTTRLRRDFHWVSAEGQKLVDTFLVPPMQVVAAALNFVTILVANRHMLELPLNSVRDFKDARVLVAELSETRQREAA